MQEKKIRVNKEHPDYQKYADECRQLMIEWHKEENEIMNNYPNYKGLDSPANYVGHKYLAKMKEIKKKYSYLFTE